MGQKKYAWEQDGAGRVYGSAQGAQAVLLSSGRCVVIVQVRGMGKEDLHGFLPPSLSSFLFLGDR